MTLLEVFGACILAPFTFTLGIYLGRILERWRCATLVQEWPDPYPPRWVVAEAIRARGRG